MADRKDKLTQTHTAQMQRLLDEADGIAALARQDSYLAAKAAATAKNAKDEANEAAAEAKKNSEQAGKNAADRADQDAVNADESAAQAEISAAYTLAAWCRSGAASGVHSERRPRGCGIQLTLTADQAAATALYSALEEPYRSVAAERVPLRAPA